MGIDDIFISFVTSYISGELLSFKESFFQRKKENMTIQEHIECILPPKIEQFCH